MRRLLAFILCLAAVASFAKPNVVLETRGVVQAFWRKELNLNQAINRVKFLGGERVAADVLANAYPRTFVQSDRERTLEFLAGLEFKSGLTEETFLGALQEGETADKIIAARGLGLIRSAKAVKPLVALLTHQALGVRRESARALGLIGRPEGSAPLLKAAKDEADLDVKLLMLQSAGRAGDKKQAAALEAWLKDSSESTRLAAGQGLCALGVPACTKFAGALLGSADRSERLQGVMLFEGAPAKAATPALSARLKDDDAKVRARAARLLAQGGDKSKVDWLIIESAKAEGEGKFAYEDELEKLRVTDEQRGAVLKKAGLK